MQRYANGTVSEGRFVDDERSGRWVNRETDGNVLEGPYVDSKRHRAWVIHRLDGTTQTLTCINGERQ